MSELSFSRKTKEVLSDIPVKKGCCRHAFSDAVSIKNMTECDRIHSLENEKFICTQCLTNYIRGLFISFGNMTDPSKGSHMEFSLKTEKELDIVCNLLSEFDFPPKKTVRKGRYIAYFKNSETIGDLLCKIGANSSAFDMMNERIISGIRNDTNRQVNCDSANIEKTLIASEKYINAITKLKQNDLFNELPDNLKETASLRIEYPELNLAELGLKFNQPISKSGVNHRLEKILVFAKSKNLI